MTQGNDKKKHTQEEKKGTNGATLEVSVNGNETLPGGLVRLPSGSIAVTGLYCPSGHNLVDDEASARFNQFSGIALMVEGKEAKGKVILSPIHGDDTKFGAADFEPGEVLKLSCPTCGESFPIIQDCGCTEGATLVGLYLSKELEDGNQVAVCTAWGCLRSRIIDRFQVISKLE